MRWSLEGLLQLCPCTPPMRLRPALFINFSMTGHSWPLCHVLWHSIYLIPLRVPWDPKPLYNCLSFHFPFLIGSSLEWLLGWNDLCLSSSSLLVALLFSPLLFSSLCMFAMHVFCALLCEFFFPTDKKTRLISSCFYPFQKYFCIFLFPSPVSWVVEFSSSQCSLQQK